MSADQKQGDKLPADVSLQLNAIRREFLESVSTVLLTLALVGLPLSLSRTYNTGLNFNHAAHLCITALIFVVFFVRKNMADRRLLIMIMLIFSMLSLAAFVKYGIVSAGFFFAATCVFIAVMALGVWGGVICAASYFAVIGLMAYLWMSGLLTFEGNLQEYILLPSVWALLSVAFIITTAVFFVSANGFFRRLKELVGAVVEQRQEMQEQAEELIRMNSELESALSEVKTLSGLLPICSHCKKIRDDKGYWNQIEVYIQDHSEADFSHSICPDCAKKIYPQMKLYDN
ncbi:hypothetical protein SAMN02745216_00187 [Desulfatibacillum alkenivorans DSM 16219]|jgi:hypothetical protein|uniref:Uncharacterized protein n=1 Tax=Desulfatibacillum alkenivorans DSM 16219 TaxID=1121393 RepID=A0A1M6C9X2_9BACT|nr:hypothetical protein [Desulfatibacillum alkenivorans]SHI57683.1 hypothetical protein SAMN02745216_00187 [Desulfatibacillum alkenivorans DSM 16219]